MAEDRPSELDETLPAPEATDPTGATLAVRDGSLDATLSVADAGGGALDSRLPEVAADRYEVGAEVGRGALGRVVAARDAVLGRTVALKELIEDSPEGRRRFEREIQITARLQHPSIVPLYDAGRRGPRAPFYAMKLVGGRPLSEVIAGAATLDERLRLLPNVVAIADAVAYAHGERIVHRDLKPHNVLVGAHGETIVIDWGIAKDLARGAGARQAAPEAGPLPAGPSSPAAHETALGTLLGTPAYMAPEQALGLEVDERADVYGLGAILYHVISGTGPHEGRTLAEVLDRAGRAEIEPLPRREPRVPRELWDIVAKAMARAPEDRYRDASQFADDLRRYTTDQLVGAHTYSLAQRARRWVRRNAAATVALTLLGAFVAWSSWSLGREQRNAIAGARLELELAAAGVQRDVAFSLDQADAMLASLRTLADPSLPLPTVAARMTDLVVGRPGVANVSVGFPDGLFRGSFLDGPRGDVCVQESVVGPKGTTRRNYRVRGADLEPIDEQATDYDVRRRPHYALAESTRARAWTPPRTYFSSGTTGITCTEPVLGADGALRAVTTVDFDVAALSAFILHPPIEGARTILFAHGGTVLAFPAARLPEAAAKEGRLLRHEDFGDPAVEALFAALAARPDRLGLFELHADGKDYLAVVRATGGRRAHVEAPLDWYVATLAPSDALLGGVLAHERRVRAALAAALAGAGALVLFLVRRGRASRPSR